MLYDKYTIYVTPNTHPTYSELDSMYFFIIIFYLKKLILLLIPDIIKCAGGSCINKMTDFPVHQKKILVISDVADKALWPKIKRKYPKIIIIDTEAFMVSILQQKIEFAVRRIIG